MAFLPPNNVVLEEEIDEKFEPSEEGITISYKQECLLMNFALKLSRHSSNGGGIDFSSVTSH